MPETYHPFVFCCGPGVLRGVHVAGTIEALLTEHFNEPDEDRRILKQLRGIRACSAGVPSSLFFAVAKRLEEGIRGADIYTSDLTGTRFLNVHRIMRTYAHSARQLLSPTVNRPPPVVDIDYLMDQILQKLPGDYRERLRALPFDYDIEVFNRETRRVEVVSMKTAPDPLKLVADSITAIPGVLPPPDQTYVDAAVARALFNHAELRDRYPLPHRIVYIANEPPSPDRIADRTREWITHLFYGFASIRDDIGPGVFLECWRDIDRQVKAIRADEHALLLSPQFRPPLRDTTRESVLWRLRREGRAHLPRILRFLRRSPSP